MNFDYNETQQMLLDSAERLMKAQATVEHWRARRELADGLDVQAWTQFGELGWLALPVPENVGGLGGGMEDVALLMIALGKGLSTEPYVSTAVLGGRILEQAGGERSQALLGQIAAGEARVALAHMEAADRYELDTPRATRAQADANGYVLNGSKMLALDAPSAHHLIVSAELEGETALFLVDVAGQGVGLQSYPLIDGSRAADIELKDVHVDGDALLVRGGRAVATLADAVDRASVALIAQAVGSMEASLEICSAYIKERKQFGQPIGAFQALQHLIVDMLIATHQARSMLYQALSRIDDTPEARRAAVSSAKIVAGEAMQLVSRTGIQLHGGYGLTDEYAISHHFRRLQVLEKSYGDVEHHVRRLAAA
jgi:alkylation response protein AidB-like acyl-CoA dehydrogenase